MLSTQHSLISRSAGAVAIAAFTPTTTSCSSTPPKSQKEMTRIVTSFLAERNAQLLEDGSQNGAY